VRVVGALGAIAVAGIALRDIPAGEVRGHLIAVGDDALGHGHSAPAQTSRPPRRLTNTPTLTSTEN
jgi:hypothetical protein